LRVAYASVMRIVHVSDAYAPRIGGMETQVHSLAQQQAAAGHDVYVLTATLGRAASGEALGHGAIEHTDGVEVHRLACKMPAEIPTHPRQNSLIATALRDLKPDVVHCHAGMLSPFAFAGIRQALKQKLPVVVTWHSTFTGWSAAFKTKAWCSGWDQAPIAWTAVGSPGVRHVARMLTTRRAPAPVVTTLPNGIDLASWVPSKIADSPLNKDGIMASWQAPEPRRLRVVATQRLEIRKRTIPLLRALARARQMVPAGVQIELLIAGTGSQDRAVNRWIKRNQAGGWVTRAGKLCQRQLANLYRNADVFVAPAPLEAFGIAALEARAAGLAIVARSGSGVADFVEHRVSGLLVDDDEAFAGAVAQLAVEADLVDRMKRYNSEHAPKFGWETVLKKTDQEYLRAQALAKRA